MKKIDKSHLHFEKAKSLGQSIAKRLDEKLGRPATLQDYIEDFITQTTYKEIEKKFWGLVTIWEATGRDISDAQKVYDELFEEDKKTIKYIEYGNMDFQPNANKTYEDQLDELHAISNYNDEVSVEKINSNDEVRRLKSDKPLKKKEVSDYLIYIWGAAALFFLLTGMINKYPYITAIILVVIILNLLNKKS